MFEKSGRALDVDKVPKPIIDAFCMWQMVRDASPHYALGLYPRDDFDFVRAVQVVGCRRMVDCTKI